MTLVADDTAGHSRAPDYMVSTSLDFAQLLGDSSLTEEQYGALHKQGVEWHLLLGVPAGVSEAADGPELNARLAGGSDSLTGHWSREYLGNQAGTILLYQRRYTRNPLSD